MGKAIEDIIESWDHNFEKEGWHVSLLPSVRNLTWAQAMWRPANDRHCIWEIVNHVALWKDVYLERLRGEPPRPRGWAKGVDWQPVAKGGDADWRLSVQRLIDLQEDLKVELRKRSDEDIDRPLPGSTSNIPLRAIRGLGSHDAYHCGQICYIRALQGNSAKGSWDQ